MNNHPLSNSWIVFNHRGQELLRISAEHATAGEVLETCGLLARERRCGKADIDIDLADDPPAVPACFFDYWNTADWLLEIGYAVTLHDAGVSSDEIADARDSGETPAEYVTRFARKHDLTAVNRWTVEDARRSLTRIKA